jgi:hypothetical protein
MARQKRDALLIENIGTEVRVLHEAILGAGASARASGAPGIRDISHQSGYGSPAFERNGDEMQTASEGPA